MSWLLDTDTVSFALRGQGDVAARLREHRPSELAISSITAAELRYGASRRNSRRLHRLIDRFVAGIAVAPFDEHAAARYGRLAASLVSGGRQIGAFDTMIAAHALALGATLVSHNTRHFDRVRGLKREDWY